VRGCEGARGRERERHAPLVHGEEDEERARAEREQHPRRALDRRVVQMEGHRSKLEDDNVQRRGQMGEEARQRVLSGRGVEGRVVDLMARVRVAAVDVLQQPHRKPLERPHPRGAPPHKRAVHAVVADAPLVRLIDAAAVLRSTRRANRAQAGFSVQCRPCRKSGRASTRALTGTGTGTGT
jgi:hypothetical protein